ncbi:MAG: CBS domain-containing protein [Nitrospirae bacterium]|nr:MAG: CBS domain-containing protein [Nitrospirota bacterium]
MGKRPEDINEDDLRAALNEIKTYVDVTEADLKVIYEKALKHARERLTLEIPVGSVMTKDVFTVMPGSDIRDVAKLLSLHRISGIPVVDADNRVVGIVSEADILSGMGLNRDHGFKDVLRHMVGIPLPHAKSGGKAGDIMNAPAITVRAEDDIRTAAKILDEKRIKRLPVTDAEGVLIGIISRADIVRAAAA